MTEDEFNKLKLELDARESEIERRATELALQKQQFGHDREAHKLDLHEFNKLQLELEARQSEIERRETELALQKQQFGHDRETHKLYLQVQQAELDEERKRIQDKTQTFMATSQQRENVLRAAEAEVRNRALALEQKAADLHAREEAVIAAERKRDAGFVEARIEFEKSLRPRQQELEVQAEALRKREADVAAAEKIRDVGFAEARRALDIELHARRQEVEQAIAKRHADGISRIDQELADERSRRRETLDREIDADRSRALAKLEATRIAFDEQQSRARAVLEEAHEAANQREAKLTTLARELDLRKRSFDNAEAAFRERQNTYEEELANAVAERRASFQQREETLKAELNRLRSQLQGADRMNSLFEGLKKQLGGRDAEVVLAELEAQKDDLRRLREELAQVPPALREQHDRLCAERDRLRQVVTRQVDELENLKARFRGEESIRRELVDVQDQANWLSAQNEALESRCEQLKQENKRLRAAYQREEERKDRIRDIETIDPNVVLPRLRGGEMSELEWLAEIDAKCKDYGILFHPRILKAFHTSLKTAEWSPLTVLAGVSGTGKSELPRLYAHFGGMTFMSLPVQPNWDSQESMLGYFNPIENKFDAQPVLKLLVRSQSLQDEANRGLCDSVVLILLDEMNLAHAELYFAEFLSKLELRRGQKGNPVNIDVKLGSGMSYPLALGRNVLWTGTMNQDETTKSLSDKVLDRSIVIHFPRPARLERRRELKPLPAAAPLLHRRIWESWWIKGSKFTDEQIAPFKSMIEGINDAMAKVGRALGHRVWQSVEYYMANYPDTLEAQRMNNPQDLQRAMRTAFEDQLVQKVMPKLRGIETRGRSKSDCLDKIRGLIEENEYDLLEDFNLSCEWGYGQFIWQTSSFLKEPAPALGEPTPATELSAATSPPTAGTASASTGADDVPPPNFYPADADRDAKWRQLSGRKRAMYLAKTEGKSQ